MSDENYKPFDDDVDLLAAMEDMKLPSAELGASGLSMSDVASQKGAIFEIKEQSEAERKEIEEEEKENLWWSKEDLLNYLNNAGGGDSGDHNPLVPFDELIPEMQVVFSSDNDLPAVYKKIVRHGAGPKITENTSIQYHLNAYLDGVDEPFDSTTIRGRPFTQRLSTDSVVPGLFYGLLTMREGEKAHIIVTPDYAFGKLGCPPRIPGDSSILYVIEVLKVFKEGTIGDYFTLIPEEQQKLSFDVVLAMADEERQSANGYFKEGKIREAACRYLRSIKVLEDRMVNGPEEERRMKEVLFKVYCNYANTSVHLKRPLRAMTMCKKALSIKPNHAKALYFYGVAKLDHGDYDEARRYLLRAQAQSPGSQDVTKQLTRLEKLTEEERIQEKVLYQKIGSGLFKP